MSRELGRFTLVKNENLTSGVWQETGFREVNDKRDTSHYKNEEVVGEICVIFKPYSSPKSSYLSPCGKHV
jgi:hypothetical protein